MIPKPDWFERILLFFVRTKYRLALYNCEDRSTKIYHYKMLDGRAYLIKEESEGHYDC